ncbi:helix-turn-helix domain-containing protein [Glutamicibacter sp. MCAF14]|uniref:helix-turn-helix domain-containing protein n=1 Tax=Glutamicibacter sp. MCAF14 TaxID=3233043 RepID=UPI003F92B76F
MNTRITPEEAAELANIPVTSFRQRMTRLNDTPNDLRAPKKPGERARSYDAKKVTQWIADGMPTKTGPKNAPRPTAKNATTYTATATRSGHQISAHFAEIDLTVSARTATELEALAQQKIAERFKTTPAKVQINLKFELPTKAHEHLDQLTEAKEQFKEIHAKITQLQHDTAAALLAAGWSHAAIAEVLDVSSSRVYQILNTK